MARPKKHPDSGIYYVRRAFPIRLQPLVVRSIGKLSLQTKDSGPARLRFIHAMHKIEARWARLSAGPAVLSEREAHELAAPARDR
ncbi:DUF6538 domain-containing protein [Methylorubrum extorquens]